MNILPIIAIWLACVVVLSFIKLRWGIALYLIYFLLVPNIDLNIPGLAPGHIMFFMVISYFFHYRNTIVKFDWRPFAPFVAYFCVSLLMMPFQDGVPLDYAITNWRRHLITTLFLPILIWNTVRVDPSSLKLFRYTLFLCIVIAIVYGFTIIIAFDGMNPYIMYLMQYLATDVDFEKYYSAEGDGRIFGRISSVFLHPMNYALFLGFVSIYLYYCRKRINKVLLYILFLSTLIMTIVCGVRSVLGGLFVTLLYYILVKRNYKLLLYALVYGLIGIIIVSFIPDLSDYLGSMADIDNKKGDVKGSSIEMRLSQLSGSIDEASNNPFFGLGYGWTDYYLNKNESHPICLAFESLLYVIICNSGILGIILWIYMIIKYFITNKNMKLIELPIVNALMVFYISYSVITGEYGYMKYFLIFYAVFLGEAFEYNKTNIKENGKKNTSNSNVPSPISSYT